jgi:histidine triad (HIT) family protein
MTRPAHSNGEETPCIFCRIASGEAAAEIVFEDKFSIAFLDSRPLFSGHCLLITKAHYETFVDLPGDLVGPMFLNAQRLAVAVKAAMDAEGTFVAINNIVSQSVPHFHIHIVPRRRKDGLRGFFWPRKTYASAEEARSVRAALSAQWMTNRPPEKLLSP